MPWMRATLCAVGINGVVQTTAVGMPSFSKVMPSCKLHDEQEPQSPLEVTITSQRETSSSTISCGQGRDAEGFESFTMLANS